VNPALKPCTDRCLEALESIAGQALRKFVEDTLDDPRPLVDEGGIELQRRGTLENLGIGVGAGSDPTDPDEGDGPGGMAGHEAQKPGRGGEERPPAQATGFIAMTGSEARGAGDGGVRDDERIHASLGRHLDDGACRQVVEIGRHLEKDGPPVAAGR
jgi:hypothetical protein